MGTYVPDFDVLWFVEREKIETTRMVENECVSYLYYKLRFNCIGKI